MKVKKFDENLGYCRVRVKVIIFVLAAVLMLSFCGCSNIVGGSECGLLYCINSGKLLYGEGCDERIAPASLTKLLTASVALKYIPSDRVFTVGTELEIVPPHSSLCLIAKGHRLRLYDLIAGMLMVSGNDAAYTVAVSAAKEVSGDENLTDREAVEYFCGLMNDFAADLGMSGSRFTSPDGSDSDGQYTTLSDLLLLARHAWSVPEIREIVSEAERYTVFESGENITWKNTNRLLDPDDEFYCEYAVGMKTGTTVKAGNCLIAVFEKDGEEYVSVVARCFSDRRRYEFTLEIFYEFA